jgi:site-specific recombinase XerD
MKSYSLPTYVQRFFTERLATQLDASPNTVASYRDTFRLLLKYASDRLKRQPTALQLADIDAELIGGFLTFVEIQRGNGARSRNTRLAAIHSFFKYVAVNEPQLLHHCQQVLAMPSKRYEKRTIDYLPRGNRSAHRVSRPHLLVWPPRRDPASARLADRASSLGVNQSHLR